MPGEYFQQFLGVIGKDRQGISHLLSGHSEERPIIPQPQCGRCYYEATLEVIGSKQSCAVKQCKPNSDDDDDDDELLHGRSGLHFHVDFGGCVI